MDNLSQQPKVVQRPGIIIDFKALFMELLDKALIILFSGIFCGLATYLACSTIISLNYESTTKIYIMPQETDNQSAYVNLEIGSLLTTDYIELIQGRDVVEKTIEEFGLDLNYEQFLNKISVNNPTDTRIIEISIKDKDPYLARNLAIYLRDTAMDAIENGMGIEGITVWEEANLPLEPMVTAPVYAALIAVLACCAVSLTVVVRYLAIDKIVSADDIENRLNITVLGAIAMDSVEKKPKGRNVRSEKKEEE